MKIGKLVLSTSALIGAFMPLATGGNFFVNIHHVGGLSYLLYIIPVVLLILSIINIDKEIEYIKMWFISVRVIGLSITILSTIAGINTINLMNQQILAFQEQSAQFQREFQEEVKKFNEEFEKRWNNPEKAFKNDKTKQNVDTGQNQPQEKKIPTQQLPVSSAKPGLGTYLLAVGFVGIIILCFHRRKPLPLS